MSDARHAMGSLLRVLVICGAVVASLPAWAGPKPDAFGELAKPLNEKVGVDLIGTPLPRALDAVARQAGLNIIISPQHTGLIQGNLVNLTIDGLSAARTLNLIGIATDTDWYIREGVVLFAPRQYVRSLSIERRVYDIRELLESVPNYLGPRLDLDGSLSNTNSGGSSARQSESYGQGNYSGGGGLFGDDSADTGGDMPSRGELVDRIIELIQNSVGEQDDWLNEQSTVHEFNGTLIVNATPGELDDIGKLLDSLSAVGGRMVSTEGQFFVVPRGVVDSLEGKLVLDADGYGQLMKRLAPKADVNVRRVASGRTVCFNGQRVYVYAGADQTFLSDIEPIPDAGGVDPTLSVLRNGAVMDVKPTIALDGKHISVAVRTEAVDHAKTQTTPLPVGRVIDASQHLSGSGRLDGTVRGAGPDGKDAQVDGTTSIGGTVGDPGNDRLTGNAQLGLPEQDILQHRTNVRVSNGGAVVLTGVTSEYTDINPDTEEVIFVLRLRIVE